jgi:hypothetical protein
MMLSQIFLIFAVVCFGAVSFGAPEGRISWLGAGLTFLAVSFLVR